MIEISELDREIIAARARDYDGRDGSRVGDFVDFANGRRRRVSHIWPADWHDDGIARVQTSDGGSFYLGGGRDLHDAMNGHVGGAYVSFSGSLYESVKADTLTQTDEGREGRVWIFHEDVWGAGMGVDAMVPFRVYRCDELAPR